MAELQRQKRLRGGSIVRVLKNNQKIQTRWVNEGGAKRSFKPRAAVNRSEPHCRRPCMVRHASGDRQTGRKAACHAAALKSRKMAKAASRFACEAPRPQNRPARVRWRMKLLHHYAYSCMLPNNTPVMLRLEMSVTDGSMRIPSSTCVSLRSMWLRSASLSIKNHLG